jgi:protein ImuB
MKRVMCVWLRHLAIDLVNLRDRRDGARGDQRPTLIATTTGNRRLVHACCQRAAKLGVRAGMVLGQAGALMPRCGPRVIERTPRQERAFLRRAAERLMRFSPVVCVDEPDSILIDIHGCEHLFGGELKMVMRVRETLTRWQLAHRVSVAPTPALAWALAHFGDDDKLVCPPQRARQALSGLPIDALRLDRKAREALAELRIERVGQLMDLGCAGSAQRFGAEVLLKLDQALGNAHQWTEPITQAQVPASRIDFTGPTTRLEPIELATRRVIDQLCAQLRVHQLGVLAAELTFDRSDLDPVRLTLTLTRASSSPEHLWKLARDKVSAIHMGFGVEGVGIVARRTALVRTHQATMPCAGEPDAQNQEHFNELLDALVARLGPSRVCTIEPVASHDPVRCQRVRSVLDEPGPPARWLHDARHRPTQMFYPPLPARVVALTPDGTIHRLAWRDHQGPVLTVVGPERIEHEWWLGSSAATGGARDYFKVQDDRGVWLWVCRSHADGRWCVQGVWA